MPQLVFVATGQGIESLYEDRVDYRRFVPQGGSLAVRRNSVVNPVESGLRFVIDWTDPELITLFGARTETDDQGRPFRSHGAAVEEEVKMLKEEYFKLRPEGTATSSGSQRPPLEGGRE